MPPPEAAAPPRSALSPELRLLCVSAAQREPLTSALISGIDWQTLGIEAARHGLVPQLYRSLTALPAGAVPEAFLLGLQEQQRATVQRGLRLTAVLLEVHHALTAAGLRAIPYKGPALSAQLYGDPALRDAVDLDVLLPRAQASTAVATMAKLGFAPGREYRPQVQGQLRRYRAEIGLLRDDVLLELQWRLAPKYFSVELDFDRLWQRRAEVRIGDRALPVLSAEDGLLVLCIHAAKHHWGTLKWLADIDRLLENCAGLDWNAVLSRAEMLGVRRILLTSLWLCRSLFATPLPGTVMEHIQHDAAAAKIGRDSQKAIETHAAPSETEHHRFQLALRERRRDRWLYTWRLAWQPTESEWDAVRLPRALAWLYPAVRLTRVATKWLRSG